MSLNQRQWASVAAAAGLVASLAAKKAATATWERTTGNPAPLKRDNPPLSKLLLFTAVTAAIGAVASATAKVGVHELTTIDEPPEVVD